jgi:hypothetical protein
VPDLSRPDHLPNLREGRRPPDPSWLPRQRRGITPQMIGRYPDYDVFDGSGTWDAATAKVIADRLEIQSEFAFFRPDEQPILAAFCDVILAQDSEPRIPVPALIDDKMAAGRLDGYQYADMPDDRDTWHLTLAGLNEVAADRYDERLFAALDLTLQETIVEDFSKGQLQSESFDRLNVTRAWSVCTRMILAAFYSHPWAWNEIGFGGPAYPRGFMRLGPTAILESFERSGATSEDPAQAVREGDR